MPGDEFTTGQADHFAAAETPSFVTGVQVHSEAVPFREGYLHEVDLVSGAESRILAVGWLAMTLTK